MGASGRERNDGSPFQVLWRFDRWRSVRQYEHQLFDESWLLLKSIYHLRGDGQSGVMVDKVLGHSKFHFRRDCVDLYLGRSVHLRRRVAPAGHRAYAKAVASMARALLEQPCCLATLPPAYRTA